MNKQEAITRLSAIEAETAKLRKIIEAPETPPKPTAKEYLLDILSNCTGKVTQGYIIWRNQDGQWIFQQDLKKNILWCYWFKVWDIFCNEYNMNYCDIQALIKDVVGKALNCEEFTPERYYRVFFHTVGKALNCEEFTPVKAVLPTPGLGRKGT